MPARSQVPKKAVGAAGAWPKTTHPKRTARAPEEPRTSRCREEPMGEEPMGSVGSLHLAKRNADHRPSVSYVSYRTIRKGDGKRSAR